MTATVQPIRRLHWSAPERIRTIATTIDARAVRPDQCPHCEAPLNDAPCANPCCWAALTADERDAVLVDVERYAAQQSAEDSITRARAEASQ